MEYVFEKKDKYRVGILVKGTAMKPHDLKNHYADNFDAHGIPPGDLVVMEAPYNNLGRAPVGFIKTAIEDLKPDILKYGIEYLYVADAAYFKVLTKMRSAEPNMGYVLPCEIPGLEHVQVVLGVNHNAMIYNPDAEGKLKVGIQAISEHLTGGYTAVGTGIIKSALYPTTPWDIKAALEALMDKPRLFMDIEAFSLSFFDAGIGTITACYEENGEIGHGIAFPCDYSPFPFPDSDGNYGEYVPNPEVRQMLKEFFTNYKGEIVWHFANYDLKAIIYALWMEHPLDHKGMLEGLEVMTRGVQDTKIIAYLAINYVGEYSLGLKHLAQPYAGNWAMEEIKDIKKIPLKELLEYNLIDGLSTNYVYNTYYPKMVADDQLDIYETLKLPSLKLLVYTELVGMPMCDKAIANARRELENIVDSNLRLLSVSKVISSTSQALQVQAQVTHNARLTRVQHPLSRYHHIEFNPNSNPNMQFLLYDIMGLPVIDETASGNPATGSRTLRKLLNHTTNPYYQEVIQALLDYSAANKILSTFIPAFENGKLKADGLRYLHGGFNIGGTVSGRLSSSSPNLQNLPASSEFGKLIKSCFVSPPNGLFVGADFNSLTI